MEQLKKYVFLATQKKKLDAQLKAVKSEMADIEPDV